MSVQSTVSEAVARPVRTGTQLVASAVVVEFIDSFIVDFSEKQYAAALGLLTLVFGYIQVAVENHRGKALLRNVPPRNAPVVDDTP